MSYGDYPCKPCQPQCKPCDKTIQYICPYCKCVPCKCAKPQPCKPYAVYECSSKHPCKECMPKQEHYGCVSGHDSSCGKGHTDYGCANVSYVDNACPPKCPKPCCNPYEKQVKKCSCKKSYACKKPQYYCTGSNLPTPGCPPNCKRPCCKPKYPCSSNCCRPCCKPVCPPNCCKPCCKPKCPPDCCKPCCKKDINIIIYELKCSKPCCKPVYRQYGHEEEYGPHHVHSPDCKHDHVLGNKCKDNCGQVYYQKVCKAKCDAYFVDGDQAH